MSMARLGGAFFEGQDETTDLNDCFYTCEKPFISSAFGVLQPFLVSDAQCGGGGRLVRAPRKLRRAFFGTS